MMSRMNSQDIIKFTSYCKSKIYELKIEWVNWISLTNVIIKIIMIIINFKKIEWVNRNQPARTVNSSFKCRRLERIYKYLHASILSIALISLSFSFIFMISLQNLRGRKERKKEEGHVKSSNQEIIKSLHFFPSI